MSRRTSEMSALGIGEVCKGWRVAAVEGGGTDIKTHDKEVVVRKDWKEVAEGMAQARWAPEGVVARPLETLMGERPKW